MSDLSFSYALGFYFVFVVVGLAFRIGWDSLDGLLIFLKWLLSRFRKKP